MKYHLGAAHIGEADESCWNMLTPSQIETLGLSWSKSLKMLQGTQREGSEQGSTCSARCSKRLLVAGALQENCTANGGGCSAFRKRKVRELSKKSRLAPAWGQAS